MPSDDAVVSSAPVLRDLILETKDGEWGSAEAEPDSVEMYVIRGTDFEDARNLNLETVPVRHIPARHSARKTLMSGDVLIETAGGSKGRPTGRTVFLRDELFRKADKPVTCASFARFMRFDRSKVEPEYVYWWLQSLYQSGRIETYQVQHSGIARFQFTKFADEIRIPLPPPDAQRSVADILGVLDQKITLLRETNATLEAIAQALFKSWFVDFDPVRAKAEGRDPIGMPPEIADLFPSEFEDSALGEIPKGWRIGAFADITDVVGGATPSTKEPAYWEGGRHCWATPKDLSGMDTPVLLDTERKITDAGLAKISSGLLPVGTVLMSSRAPIGYLAIAEVPVAVNQGFIAMKPKAGISNLFLLNLLRVRMDEIKSHANGSTFMEISKAAFRPLKVVVPPPTVIQAFDYVARSLYERMVGNVRQIATLTELRDTLLPRLISGKLRLPEALIQLEVTQS